MRTDLEAMRRRALSRRSFLRGAGVTMALPWLESLHAPRWPFMPRPGDGEGPRRLVVMFSGNGFHSREWWAEGEGAAMRLGRVLEPLGDLRHKLLFLRGLYNAEALKGNIHSSQTGNLLSGAPLAAGGEIRSGTSIDQFLAQRLGAATRLPSLVLGCEKSNPSIHKNYSMLYSSHVSWSAPTTPTPLEIYPALAFDRLFKDSAERSDRYVIDAVHADGKRLRGRLGAADGHKLDEYLESVRDLEQRVAPGRTQAARRAPPPDFQAPAAGLPERVDEHMRLMCDILVLALQTDTTRFATLKLNNDHSSQRFPHLGVDAMIHHLLSHSDSADWLKVNQFFVEQVAYVARRLDAIREGSRTVLDNTMLLYLSSMLTGNHDAEQLPVVLLGSGGGAFRTGRVLDYRNQQSRQMCRLYLSMAAAMGVVVPQFGDATASLPELVA